jgi:hypothetical protein
MTEVQEVKGGGVLGQPWKLSRLQKWTQKFHSPTAGLTNPWHAGRFIWHAAFTAVLNLVYFFCPTPSLHCAEHVYIHTYRLYMNYRETFLHRSERCELLTGYLSMGRRSDGDWANMGHWAERFTVCLWTGSGSSTVTATFCYLPHFLRGLS